MISPAYALEWDNLWSRPDEQGAKLFRKGDFEQAAQHFEHDQWRGAADYRAGLYNKALEEYTRSNSTRAIYNRGTTLAHLNRYKEAIAAYKQVLAENPNHQDAKFEQSGAGRENECRWNG